ncbi:MAG: efflux RND transporter periplasmic adaptor subunit, partial [Thermodesulfobacteriota bacterium]
AGCRAARSASQVAAAQIGVAEANLAKTRLTAPFAGVVAALNGELGEYVTPSPPGILTLPAVDLVDDACFYVEAPIDEVDAPAIRPGMPARISLDAFRDRRFPGQVRRVADYVQERERQARTVLVEVDFLAAAAGLPALLAGYSADAEILLERREGVVRVPSESLLAGNRAFVLDTARDVLEERRVETGIAAWDFTEIRAGIAAGEAVVLAPDRPGVRAGARARVDRHDHD